MKPDLLLEKICTKCQLSKQLNQFYKRTKSKDRLAVICKDCKHLTDRNYYERNKNKIKEYQNTNAIIIAEHRKIRYLKNRDKESEYNKNYIKENRVKIREQAKQRARISRLDARFKLAHSLRNRLLKALKRNTKIGSAVKDLGCTIEELKLYLESKFESGMTWKNHGEWHIDHIKPLASFDLSDRNEFLHACHYSNLQPLWAIDNLRKGCK